MKTNWDIDDATPTRDDAGDGPARSLLAAIVSQGCYDAVRGDASARKWFNEPDGTFALFASLLALPVERIRRTLETNASAYMGRRKIHPTGRKQ
jgi:hypothetical protein